MISASCNSMTITATLEPSMLQPCSRRSMQFSRLAMSIQILHCKRWSFKRFSATPSAAPLLCTDFTIRIMQHAESGRWRAEDDLAKREILNRCAPNRKSSPSVRVSWKEDQQNQQMACYFACSGGLASVKHWVSCARTDGWAKHLARDHRGSEESGKCVPRFVTCLTCG